MIMVVGKAQDGFWDSQRQELQYRVACMIFALTHPPGCKGLWIKDNSCGHNAYAEDALVASKLSKGPGGGQPVLRDIVVDDKVYHTCFREGDTVSSCLLIVSNLMDPFWCDNHAYDIPMICVLEGISKQGQMHMYI